MRNYKLTDQSITFDRRTQRLLNGRDTRFCVDVWGGRNSEGRHLTYWTCHNGANQKWRIKYFPGVPRDTGFRHGQRFKIRSRMTGNRVLTVKNHIGAGQYRVVMTMPKNNNREIFYFDQRLGAIRWAASSSYILSSELNKSRNGGRLVVRSWKKGSDNTQRFQFRSGLLRSY